MPNDTKANGATGVKMPKDLIKLSDPRLEKTDSRANYRDSTEESRQCGDCRFFAWQSCSLVEGFIESSYTCDLWTEKLPSQVRRIEMYAEDGATFRVFVEASQIFKADLDFTKPTWIPFLPVPGDYKHPLYGDINITSEMNQQLVDSVKNHVYQEHIPLDAEHETKLSGAVAWIKDMRLNKDGSADAYVEFTDRGQKLVGGDTPQFRYVSPEWFSSWKDPATEEVHENVVAGGAITTRPFFKDKVLRALVASEKGAQVVAAEAGMKTCADCGKKYSADMKACPECKSTKVANEKETNVPDPKTYAEGSPELQKVIDDAKAEALKGTFTEDSPEFKAKVEAAVAEAKKAVEPQDEDKKFSELNTRVAAAEALAASEKEAREALATKLVEREKADRQRKFTELVAGKGGSGDGAPWAGDQTKHVAMLETLAAQFGEDHETVTSYIEQQAAIAVQMKESNLFREFGSGAPVANSPEGKLDALAKKIMSESQGKKTYEVSYSEALATPEGSKIYSEMG